MHDLAGVHNSATYIKPHQTAFMGMNYVSASTFVVHVGVWLVRAHRDVLNSSAHAVAHVETALESSCSDADHRSSASQNLEADLLHVPTNCTGRLVQQMIQSLFIPVDVA